MAEETEDTSTLDENEENEIEVETPEVESEEKTLEEEIEEEVEEEAEVEHKQSRRDERIQELVEETKMLRRIVEQGQRRPAPQESEEPTFEDPDVEKVFKGKLNRVQSDYRNQLGAVREELDATKFDRVLTKEGIEEGTDEYESVTGKLQSWREDQAAAGHYYTRKDAFDILKAKGTLKLKPRKEVKKVTVVRKKPHVGIESNTKKDNKGGTKKPFKQMTLDEKEKSLENVKF